ERAIWRDASDGIDLRLGEPESAIGAERDVLGVIDRLYVRHRERGVDAVNREAPDFNRALGEPRQQLFGDPERAIPVKCQTVWQSVCGGNPVLHKNGLGDGGGFFWGGERGRHLSRPPFLTWHAPRAQP